MTLEEKLPLWQNLKKLFLQKAKFAMTSGLATAVDIGLFYVLITHVFQGQWILSNTIAYGIAVLLNFTLQKLFVFDLLFECDIGLIILLRNPVV